MTAPDATYYAVWPLAAYTQPTVVPVVGERLDSGSLSYTPLSHLEIALTPTDASPAGNTTRLFRVTDVQGLTEHSFRADHPGSGWCESYRIVEELPFHLVFGALGANIIALVERLERLSFPQIRSLGQRLLDQGVNETHRWADIDRAGLGWTGHAIGNRLGYAFRTRIWASAPESFGEDAFGEPVLLLDPELDHALDQAAIALQALLLGDAAPASSVIEALDHLAPETAELV